MVQFGLGYDFRRAPGDERLMTEVYARALDAIVYAEALGFDYVALSEHHFVDDGYCPSLLPLAAAVAARTTRIRIIPYVLLLPFHNPLRLAEDVAVVDVLSGGRFELGVGAGYRLAEFRGFGLDRDDRRTLMDEGCEVLLKAWTEEGWSFVGKHWRFEDVTVYPRPASAPHPRMWISARAPVAARRAARFRAPLQIPPLQDCGVEGERASYEAWAAGLRSQGEAPETYGVMGMFAGVITDDMARTRSELSARTRWRRERYTEWFGEAPDLPIDTQEQKRAPSPEVRALSGAVGDPETVVAGLEAFLSRGIPYTHLTTGGLHDELGADGRNRYMEAFARHVLPHFR